MCYYLVWKVHVKETVISGTGVRGFIQSPLGLVGRSYGLCELGSGHLAEFCGLRLELSQLIVETATPRPNILEISLSPYCSRY